jgi:hypothetical protein
MLIETRTRRERLLPTKKKRGEEGSNTFHRHGLYMVSCRRASSSCGRRARVLATAAVWVQERERDREWGPRNRYGLRLFSLSLRGGDRVKNAAKYPFGVRLARELEMVGLIRHILLDRLNHRLAKYSWNLVIQNLSQMHDNNFFSIVDFFKGTTFLVLPRIHINFQKYKYI